MYWLIFSSGFHSKAFYLRWKDQFKIIDFFLCNVVLADKKNRKNGISFDMPRSSNSSFSSYICFFFSSWCQLMVSYLRRSNLFLLSRNLSSASKTKSWLPLNSKTAVSVEICWFAQSVSSELCISYSHQSLKCRFCIFRGISGQKNSCFNLFIEILISRASRRIYLIIVLCRLSKS